MSARGQPLGQGAGEGSVTRAATARVPATPPSPLTGPAAALGLHILDIPMPLPPLTIGMAWHPRHAADGGHHWLRGAVRRAVLPGARGPAHGGGPETPDRGGPDPSAGGGPDTAVPGH